MPRAAYTTSKRLRARAALLPLMTLGLAGCPAHIDARRAIVERVQFHGVQQVDEAALRERLAVRETSYFPSNRPGWLRWWRWWWQDPEYFDEASLTRDRLRVERFYQARGFYDARVAVPRQTLLDQRLTLDFDVTEGEPTRVADVRLRGCEPGETSALSTEDCAAIRERMDMRAGALFDEAVFSHDREQVLDFTREAGFATPTIIPRATVDPAQRLAWVEYTIRPGPRAHFREIRLYESPHTLIRGDTLPGGIPVAPVLSAIGIDETTPYSRRVIAAAQQALFNLGVFGIARIEEMPRADGSVDLEVTLSPARLWRFRLGFGGEADSSRTNVHTLVSFDHRNFLGGMRRLRIDLRPLVYLPSPFNPNSGDFVPEPGLASGLEIQQPELSSHTTGIANVGWEIGPDPVNPSVAYRSALRTGVGIEARLTRELTGSFFIRTTNVSYCPFRGDGGLFAEGNCGNRSAAQPYRSSVEQIEVDPIFRQQFFDRNYVHFEQAITWDRRDNPAAPTRGTLLALNLAEGTRSPVSDYTFLRAQVEARGYVPVRRGITLAMRGTFGAIVGSSIYSSDQRRWYWPVPPELRFYSGGTQSNRGYPFSRVGMLGVPSVGVSNGRGGTMGPATDNRSTVIAIGGTAMWEGSVELRWQPGAFGMVLFLDASNVTGLAPEPFLDPTGVNNPNVCANASNLVADRTTCLNYVAAPPPQPLADAVGSLLEFSSWDAFLQSAHPSVGLGLRYATPVGPIRLDVGVRLADLSCAIAQRNVDRQNAAVTTRNPVYYVLNSPRCDFLGFDSVPATIHFSIGEAY